MENLYKILGYKFSNQKLLETALTHISYAKDNNVEDYEKLEFLGDAVLEFCVTKYIVDNFNVSVGESCKLRSKLVGEDNLYLISKKIGLDKLVKIGNSLRNKPIRIIADLVESVIGAIYLDCKDINIVDKVIKRVIIIDKNNVDIVCSIFLDYKTLLQEKIQAKYGTNKIKYVCNNLDDKSKEISLFIDNKFICKSSGDNKKICEQECAKQALKK